MQVYLKNVLNGFIGRQWQVGLQENMRELPDFILSDIDGDDMPEIILSFKDAGDQYVGILKRKDYKWYLDRVEKDMIESNMASCSKSLVSDSIDKNKVGKVYSLEELFTEENPKFISIINGEFYYGNIMKREEITGKEVIDERQADVTGDGVIDTIYLVGDRPFGSVSGYVTNMSLQVRDGETGEVTDIPLKTPDGYYPTLYLADYTGDGVAEIQVTIFTGTIGTYIYAFIYSMKDNIPELIFDTFVFNMMYNGVVQYEDDYRVRVTTQIPAKQYMIDISEKEPTFILPVYSEDGKLLTETKGNILGLAGLNPVDLDRNGVYDLSAIQRVIGIKDTDTLGLLETLLTWDRENKMFVPFMQYLSIIGIPLEPEEVEELV